MEYDPDAAYDAWMLSRETGATQALDAAAVAAMAEQPVAEAVQFTHAGERLWAIRTGSDEFVIRTDNEYDPHRVRHLTVALSRPQSLQRAC